MQEMPRIQAVVIPLLRERFPDAQVVSWVPEKTDRKFPIFNVRRLGGYPVVPKFLDRATIELTVYSHVRDGIEYAENLLKNAQIFLEESAHEGRTVEGAGSLTAYRQTMGLTQFDSPYDDTFRIQSLIQLSIRPLPN